MVLFFNILNGPNARSHLSYRNQLPSHWVHEAVRSVMQATSLAGQPPGMGDFSQERVNIGRRSGLWISSLQKTTALLPSPNSPVWVMPQWAAGRAASPRERTDLVTGCTARLQALGVVPAAVDLAVLVEVDQVHQELVADGAYEAGGVPANPVAGARREHGDVPAINLASALRGKGNVSVSSAPMAHTAHR